MPVQADPGIAQFEAEGVRGYLHTPVQSTGRGMVLTHGAGADCNAPLLVTVADACCAAGVAVLRCDLPFRQVRPKGPPPSTASAADRAGLRAAVAALRDLVNGAVFLAGHSYGGRQASILAAEDPSIADRLLLLSYPLHPPKKPDQLRTKHFPDLRTSAVFVHGTADPFGSIAEMKLAISEIPASRHLLVVEGAGHDLRGRKFDAAAAVETLLSSETPRY